MTTTPGKWRLKLLRRLLEKYERGRSYGRPAPWPRDVIVRIDAKEFSSAFAPDGREELEGLSSAANQLAREGAARLAHHRGLPGERPREVRMGPAEVERASAMARAEGIELLEDALAALADRVSALRELDLPPWMDTFLERAARGASAGDVSLLGWSRDRFKRERTDVLDALAAAAALARGVSGWERVASERIFTDSKRLGAIRGKVAAILGRADPRWEGIEPEDSLDILEAYGVRRKPGLIRCAGRAVIEISGRAYRLEDFAPTAHLPEEWGEAWTAAVVDASPEWMTTVENEFPFLSYVLEAGGPGALGDRRELVVYTAGFPPSALLGALVEVARRAPDIRFRHWGDADLGGLRIWWLLRTSLGRPVDLFRTRADWLEAEAGRGRPLNPLEKRGLTKLRDEIEAARSAGGSPTSRAAADRAPAEGEHPPSDLAAALRLIDALLRLGRKVEQERW